MSIACTHLQVLVHPTILRSNISIHPHTTLPLHQVKDSSGPKKASGPFIFFYKDKRLVLKEKHPD